MDSVSPTITFQNLKRMEQYFFLPFVYYFILRLHRSKMFLFYFMLFYAYYVYISYIHVKLSMFSNVSNQTFIALSAFMWTVVISARLCWT